MTEPYGNIFAPKTPEPTGFQLAPVKTEGGMWSYDLERELTPEEAVVARADIRAAEARQAAYDQTLRGRLAKFFEAVSRAYAAFKDEDTGL